MLVVDLRSLYTIFSTVFLYRIYPKLRESACGPSLWLWLLWWRWRDLALCLRPRRAGWVLFVSFAAGVARCGDVFGNPWGAGRCYFLLGWAHTVFCSSCSAGCGDVFGDTWHARRSYLLRSRGATLGVRKLGMLEDVFRLRLQGRWALLRWAFWLQFCLYTFGR